MYVVTVKFRINPEFITPFMQAMQKQASDSLLLEAQCSHFDVCVSEEDPNLVFLYEIYTTKGDFDLHLQSDHFASFNQSVSAWVVSKQVECFTLTAP